jgi:hypothetical protein
MNLTIVSKQGSQRKVLEQFIHQQFSLQYGAEVEHYLPWLIGVEESSLGLQGVLGINPAVSGPLFLEQYLDQPAEALIAAQSGAVVAREGVIEVGNLAAGSAGGARLLIITLTALLHGAGYQWVTFTALPVLINSFRRLGIPLYTLAAAEPDRLPDQGRSWGRYYEGGPSVVVCNVNTGYVALQQAAIVERLQMAMIWNQAYDSGRRLRNDPEQPCSVCC